MKKQFGFTLIEVLFALSIVSYALVALIHSNNSSFETLERQKDLTLSNIILNNLTIELRLSSRPKLGSKDGVYNMAGNNWPYLYRTTEMPLIEDITKTTITLFRDSKSKEDNKPIGESIVYLNTIKQVKVETETDQNNNQNNNQGENNSGQNNQSEGNNNAGQTK